MRVYIDISTENFRGRYPTGGACMGDNFPRPKREGGVSGYWYR